MNTLRKLTLHEISKQLNLKLVLVYTGLAFFCIYFFFCSAGYKILKEEGTLEYMSIMLPQVMFGAWGALTVYYDGVAQERETHVLDCILCAGIKKRQVYLSKVISSGVTTLFCSILYFLPLMIALTIKTGTLRWTGEIAVYILPLWIYIFVYAVLGLFVSVVLRSSKKALICSVALGLVLMPRFYISAVEGISSLLHLGEGVQRVLQNLSPGVLISDLAKVTTSARIQAVIQFLFYSIAINVGADLIFQKQDEYGY